MAVCAASVDGGRDSAGVVVWVVGFVLTLLAKMAAGSGREPVKFGRANGFDSRRMASGRGIM